MSNSPDHHSVRRVVLPSGKTIEVIYFEDAPALALPVAASSSTHVDGLHVCPHCASELVQPADFDEAGPRHWEMTLLCPECQWTGGGIFDQDRVDSFEEELDRGTEVLVRDLKRLMQANMEDEIDRFVRALRADAILPIDF